MVISKALIASVLAASVAGAAGFAPLMLLRAPNTVRGTRAVWTGAGGGRTRGVAKSLRSVATSGAEVKTETSGLGLSEGLKVGYLFLVDGNVTCSPAEQQGSLLLLYQPALHHLIVFPLTNTIHGEIRIASWNV